jgi:hypothetical protein
LLKNNQPALAEFNQWLFQPGMRFNSLEQWWGAKKKRARAHEGLDLSGFIDARGQIRRLDQHIRIPATFAGAIVKIDRDFLGKSIYLGHEIFAADGRQLYTAYGHTDPLDWVKVGAAVREGDLLATIAAIPDQRLKILPHLHLTFAFIPVPFPLDQLNWDNLGRDRTITLVDPLPILSNDLQQR